MFPLIITSLLLNTNQGKNSKIVFLLKILGTFLLLIFLLTFRTFQAGMKFLKLEKDNKINFV